MAFEVFTRQAARLTKDPQITIQRRGNLSLNASAAALVAGEKEPDQLPVELLYDPKEKMVGIRQAESTLGSYNLRKQQKSESYLVSGRAFTEYYGINTDVARRYQARELGDGIIGFGLDDQHLEVGRKRS